MMYLAHLVRLFAYETAEVALSSAGAAAIGLCCRDHRSSSVKIRYLQSSGNLITYLKNISRRQAVKFYSFSL